MRKALGFQRAIKRSGNLRIASQISISRVLKVIIFLDQARPRIEDLFDDFHPIKTNERRQQFI